MNLQDIQETPSKVNIKEFIKPYLKKWYWFVFSLLVCVAIAFAVLRYSKPIYGAEATILIADETKLSPEASVLEGLSETPFSSTKVEGEIQVLKSRELMQTVVEDLKLNLQIFAQGRISDVEIYQNQPFTLNFLAKDSVINKSSLRFTITIISETSFNYAINDRQPKTYLFGENVPTSLGSLIVIPNLQYFKKYTGEPLKVVIKPVSSVREHYKNKLSVSSISKGSNIVSIYLTDPVQDKAKDIVNKLTEVYNQSSIEEKNQVAKATSEFIDERINLIATDLSEVDLTKERFKVGNKLTDITSEAGIFLESGAQNEQNLIQLGTELNTVNYMSDYIGSQENNELLPTNIGLSDPNISSITTKYNELVLERQRLLKTSGENNPIVVQLDQQLNGLRSSMQQSLNNLKSTINIQTSNLRAQEDLINSRISSVPGQERKNRDIQRQQNIKETIYLYLLQKREESAISMAATSPSAKVIEPAYSSYRPISSGTKIYFASLFLGLLLPFGFIYFKELLDTKIHKKEDITETLPNMSVLVQLPHIEHKKELTIQVNDRSVLAESFRILRTNIDYLFNKKDSGKGEVIYVTSTIPGEGKSFVSYNLATVYAYSNKNVLLIGADIRKPSLTNFITNSSQIGLSEYLHGDAEIDDIIKPVLSFNSLDVIQSGKIPPNPAELLMDNRLDTLFKTVKDKYDVILVDTAPTLPVTDTVLISKYADRTIYVTRANYTEKSLLSFVKELYIDKKLKNISLIINDVKAANLGYGAKMGYGYIQKDNKKKKWF
ncbi:GumC family protein [Galbibacter pacificus]|uniref:non-specific protein-tyrosine kinase n=1 Tax=Galbibacter pacificus TaxID=2996052 RepID=A0ABT6FR81_9FLAO|nr:polysaccharide biosynthesis tyrosine autokinase [Galbibacter pacificus]MDG3581744.1 polysaccharide biosynthesis tyrosine autokinase [Galbibacter pacificus]MDG3585782.1 polysaccharide biosynthesis tyrosine autokinase [Galbibacter pacificus]